MQTGRAKFRRSPIRGYGNSIQIQCFVDDEHIGDIYREECMIDWNGDASIRAICDPNREDNDLAADTLTEAKAMFKKAVSNGQFDAWNKKQQE